MRIFKLLAIAVLLASALAGVSVAAKAGTADLAISKGDSPDPVGVGTALTYTIGVQNLGPESAGKVTVTDQLPEGVDFVSATTAPANAPTGAATSAAISARLPPAAAFPPQLPAPLAMTSSPARQAET